MQNPSAVWLADSKTGLLPDRQERHFAHFADIGQVMMRGQNWISG
jgi:hypothetical protein